MLGNRRRGGSPKLRSHHLTETSDYFEVVASLSSTKMLVNPIRIVSSFSVIGAASSAIGRSTCVNSCSIGFLDNRISATWRCRPAATASQAVITDNERRTIVEMMAKGTYGWIIVATTDLDDTFERLQASDAEVVQEPVEQPYGVRDCALRDPAGNLIRIQELR
jgi:hypothetical protein